MPPKTVLITGANGYLGNAISRSFSQHGWKTYGCIRSATSAPPLAASEIIPVVGSYTDSTTWTPQLDGIVFDVLVSTIEVLTDYQTNFNSWMELFKYASKAANNAGRKPLLLFTSGNKDYGESGLHQSREPVQWFEEDSPLNPPEVLKPRATTAVTVFESQYQEYFYPALFRPCMVYGRTGSYYAYFLGQAALTGSIIVGGSPDVIWHGVHVDDVAAAYFAVATKMGAKEANGKVFTVANDEYDTFRELAEGVARAYGGKRIEYGVVPEKGDMLLGLMGFSQALKSERLRSLTGWRPEHIGFLEGLEVYKAAFDAALEKRDPAVVNMLESFGIEIPASR
ncbi:hypothetical protein MMC10_003715 [Thelotrema lepadinum]|nr:hypothetical protein [Thelotrema lepadinum]